MDAFVEPSPDLPVPQPAPSSPVTTPVPPIAAKSPSPTPQPQTPPATIVPEVIAKLEANEVERQVTQVDTDLAKDDDLESETQKLVAARNEENAKVTAAVLNDEAPAIIENIQPKAVPLKKLPYREEGVRFTWLTQLCFGRLYCCGSQAGTCGAHSWLWVGDTVSANVVLQILAGSFTSKPGVGDAIPYLSPSYQTLQDEVVVLMKCGKDQERSLVPSAPDSAVKEQNRLIGPSALKRAVKVRDRLALPELWPTVYTNQRTLAGVREGVDIVRHTRFDCPPMSLGYLFDARRVASLGGYSSLATGARPSCSAGLVSSRLGTKSGSDSFTLCGADLDGGTAGRRVCPADQWSPINPDGKKKYERDFLMELQNDPSSRKKPDNLPDLEVVLQDGQNRPVTKRNSQQGSKQKGGGKPNMIHVTLSLNQDIKLRETENAWKPGRLKNTQSSEEEAKTEELYKKVRSVLNKLTPQKFQTLVSQVHSLPIDNAERLQGVINIVFEKAVDEPNFSEAYAHMCVMLSEMKQKTDPEFVQFRKLLITRCQRHFEKSSEQELDCDRRLKEIKECQDPVSFDEHHPDSISSSRPCKDPVKQIGPVAADICATLHFRQSWHKEYLHTLQPRGRWTKSEGKVQIEDLVLVKEDHLPPLQWQLGSVAVLHPGKDGVKRPVLRMPDGCLLLVTISPVLVLLGPLEMTAGCSDRSTVLMMLIPTGSQMKVGGDNVESRWSSGVAQTNCLGDGRLVAVHDQRRGTGMGYLAIGWL
ncbi:hypothetical protein PR048_002943 [Dryococelus australis]|uniref:MIF4G domain-containing protein n=1 Tax=Dryococelus australis TaxID=614101 RepID=A0ABQ9IN15_9NEOP|nr:hypothetical protein PR048_002943 [Dryococelus australis]